MTQFSSLYGTRLDRELGTDDSTTLFTTAKRKAAVNEGLEQFAELTECWQKVSTLAITSGQAEYDLSTLTTDFVRFSEEQVEFHYTDTSASVQVLAGDDLRRRDIDWLNRYRPGWQVSTLASTNLQMPDLYYLTPTGGQVILGFSPMPCLGSSNQTAKAIIPYVAQPPILVSDTSVPFGGNTALLPWHQAAVHYAASQLEKLRRDMQASQTQFQQFMVWVQRYSNSARVKNGLGLTFARTYFKSRSQAVPRDPRT